MALFKSYVDGSNPVMNYMLQNGLRRQDVLEDIIKATLEAYPTTGMMLDELEAQLFRVVLKSINAKKCIEIGVFTGYNTANVALTLPDDGKVVALDVSEEFVNLGRPIWEKYGLNKKIDVVIGDAKQSMQTMIDNGEEGTYDFVLIDADKVSYDDYYEKSLKLLRVNGLIAIDNVIWDGKVAEDESKHDASTKAIHALNKKVHKDERVDMAMIMVGDGVTFCRKK